MTNLITGMTTTKHLATWLQTVRNGILARGARGEAGDVGQLGFATWATGDTVWRHGAVSRMGVLRMASLLARMQTTVKGTIANIVATKATRPLFLRSIIADYLTIHFFVLRAAKHFSLHLATVTTSLDLNFTSTTQALMARKRAGMFAARQKIPTDLTTAPSTFIVCILTPLG
jgi:hypothetical protein